jgi:serine/threonine protein kinase
MTDAGPVKTPTSDGRVVVGGEGGAGPQDSRRSPEPGGAAQSGSVLAAAARGEVQLPKRCSSCGNRYPEDFNVCPRDATPLESADGGADPFLGKVLGETYKIERLVGEGGMGRVYEARHLRLRDRRFAVKVLHPELARQAEVVARFQREAESASSVSHPNVVDVFDVHKTSDGIPYLVGEFLQGEELGAYLGRKGALEVPIAVGIARQVCRALAAAHARGIVHRDMKPENVFITQQDGATTIKVLDFGISKANSRETHLTRTGMIMGTPSYMAPEQARGDKVDHRVDVYAIGALLYQALTAKRPFDSEDATSTLTMVLTEEPPRPRSIVEGIPEALELVVQKAMAKDVRDRYQSTQELDAALAPFDVTPVPDRPSQADPVQPVPAAGPQPVNVTARTMMAGAAAASALPESSQRSAGQDARRARPTIVVLSGLMALWLIGGSVDALGGIVRYVRDGDLTSTESLLLGIGCVFAVATPAYLFIARVRKTVWPNSVHAVELAKALRYTAATAFATYGLATVMSRAVLTVILRESASLRSGLWDAIFFGVSVLGAALAGGIGSLARARRRKANR